MPMPNTRVVVVGSPRADREFDLIDLSRARLEKLARDLASDCERAKRELERITLGRPRR